MTLGLLLKDLRNHDATRKLANNTGAKATGPLEVGSAGMHYVLAAAKFHEDANCVWTAIMARPGIGRIQAICEAETGRFDSETLKIIRGRLCVSLNVEPSAVDAMGLERFADAWRSMNGPPNEVAASPKPESPVELPTGKSVSAESALDATGKAVEPKAGASSTGEATGEGRLSAAVAPVRGVYDWALAEIEGANDMTIAELFDAIRSHPEMTSEYLDILPDNADTFGKYLRRAGIRRYGSRARRPSRHPRT